VIGKKASALDTGDKQTCQQVAGHTKFGALIIEPKVHAMPGSVALALDLEAQAVDLVHGRHGMQLLHEMVHVDIVAFVKPKEQLDTE
jgi:hypothetical protein